MKQTNPNCSHYNACLIDLISRLREARVETVEQLNALASDMPQAWRSHLINDALEAISN